MKDFISALFIFIGTVVGVGMFALPYTALKSGISAFLFFCFLLSFCLILIEWSYGKVSLGTKGKKRLPGYVQKYLGDRWGKFALFISLLGSLFALVAYLIIGGNFLEKFFSPYFRGTTFVYTIIFYLFGSYLIFKGIKIISNVQILLFFIFALILFVFLIKFSPFITIKNFKIPSTTSFIYPYELSFFL